MLSGLKLAKHFLKFVIFDWLGQESVHARLHSLLLEAGLAVSCAAANVRYLLITVQNAVLEEATNLGSYLRSIHLWHAVVKQDDAIHLGLAAIDSLKATLDHSKCFGAF